MLQGFQEWNFWPLQNRNISQNLFTLWFFDKSVFALTSLRSLQSDWSKKSQCENFGCYKLALYTRVPTSGPPSLNMCICVFHSAFRSIDFYRHYFFRYDELNLKFLHYHLCVTPIFITAGKLLKYLSSSCAAISKHANLLIYPTTKRDSLNIVWETRISWGKHHGYQFLLDFLIPPTYRRHVQLTSCSYITFSFHFQISGS